MRPADSASWGGVAVRRIVAVRLSALGDVLLSTPALEALKARFPDARLTFVTAAAYAPLLEGLPFLDEVIGFDRARHGGGAGARRLAAELRAAGPVDLFVDLQHKARTILLGARLRPRRRIVFRKRTLGGSLQALLDRETPLSGRHATRMYLDALLPLGVSAPAGDEPVAPKVAVPEAALAEAEATLPGGGLRVAVAPGARWVTKRWEPARFAAVASALAARGAQIVLVGGPDDVEVLDACVGAMRTPPVLRTDRLGLPVLAGLLARCDLLVSNDSGPVHLASALGVPVVGVFGPTEPSRWGPSSDGSRVVRHPLECAPCSNHGGARCPQRHLACLRRLPASMVLREAERLLGFAPADGEPLAAGPADGEPLGPGSADGEPLGPGPADEPQARAAEAAAARRRP